MFPCARLIAPNEDELDTMFKTPAYAVVSAKTPLVRVSVERRESGPHDVLIDILYCGVCHSDIHQARDEWSGAIFPMVPGHGIVGTVVNVGDQVDKWKVGDTVGVGCFVDSCRKCEACKAGEEQFCAEHGLACDVEVIPIQSINEAYERMMKGDVSYRFVIDAASLKELTTIRRWHEERFRVSAN